MPSCLLFPLFPFFYLPLSFLSSSFHSALNFHSFCNLFIISPFHPRLLSSFLPHPFHSSCLHTFPFSFYTKTSFPRSMPSSFINSLFLSRSIPSFLHILHHSSSSFLIYSIFHCFFLHWNLPSIISSFIPLSFPSYTASFFPFLILWSIPIILH